MAAVVIDIDAACKIIRDGKFFEVSTLTFDINKYVITTRDESHDSNSFENEHTYITEETLLHIAIQCKNKKAIKGLTQGGSNLALPLKETEKRRQRHVTSGSGFWGGGSWSEWEEWEPKVTTISTIELAQKTKDPKIISIFESPGLDLDDSDHADSKQLDEPKVDEIDEKLKASKIDIYKDKVVKKTGERKSDNRKVSMYGFPSKEVAKQKEFLWQKQVCDKFFKIGKPLREGTKSHDIHLQVTKQLSAKEKKPLVLDGLCRRSFIIALSKILTEHGEMPNLIFKIGTTQISFIPTDDNGKKRQLGNFKMEIENCFDIAYGNGCITRLKYFLEPSWDYDTTNKRRRKEILLKLITDRLPIFTPFTYRDLNKYGNIRVFDEETCNPYDTKSYEKIKPNLHFLNGLIFLVTIVEVLVRGYRTEKGEVFDYNDPKGIQSDSFPVAMAQARSLSLLLSGKIAFADFLGQSKTTDEDYRASYGAVTAKGTIDNIQVMLEKLLLINERYNDYHSELEFWRDLKTTYLNSNNAGYLISGKSRMFCDLKADYGSGSESEDDSSDYSDSEEFSKDKIVAFKV